MTETDIQPSEAIRKSVDAGLKYKDIEHMPNEIDVEAKMEIVNGKRIWLFTCPYTGLKTEAKQGHGLFRRYGKPYKNLGDYVSRNIHLFQ